MSGTSLDGISAAVVRFTEKDGVISPELLAFLSRPYTVAQRRELEARLIGGSALEFARFDFDLGAWLADAAVAVIAEAGVARADIAAVASHGHTVWHDPPHATLQMGNAAVIAERTGVAVISDFRSRDLAAGGQGAPLVTIADAMLFASAEKWRATLNLGGIANVQLIPPGGVMERESRDAFLASVRAFDTGPGVGVLDATVRVLEPNLPYDVGGTLARRGVPVAKVVDDLLMGVYFTAPPPKSTGRELFSPIFAQQLIERCRREKPGCSSEDVIATATSFTARSIALSFEKFIPEPVADVLVSGGGAKNPALFDAIRMELERTALAMKSQVPSLLPFDQLYFDGEAKEAVAFAFLGWLHLQGRPGNVPGATGARGPRILGSLTPA